MHTHVTTPFLFLLAAAGYSAASVAADEPRAADKAAIATILQEVERGWETGDGRPFRTHFLDFEGARYFESGGQNVGLDDLVLHHVEPEKHAIEGLEVDFLNVTPQFEGDFAWVLADTRVAGKVLRTGEMLDRTGFATFLLRQVDGAWKVVHTHSSTRPRKTQAPAVQQPHHEPKTPAIAVDEAAAGAVSVVEAFNEALVGQDLDAAGKLLADDVLILESGGAERSRDEYLGHHAKADAKFLAGSHRTLKLRKARIAGDLAWVGSQSELHATRNGKAVVLSSTETMVLRRAPQGWRIVHIHWSSRPAPGK